MAVQEKLERVLREIHVLFAGCRHLKTDENQILVDKNKIFQLLNQLNVYVYEMMDEQEITQASKDKIRRDAERKGDRIILEAEKKAEDIYAASVLYTNESLHHVQNSIDRASEEVEILLRETQEALKLQKDTLRANQLELTEQLQDMADARTYFKLIEDRNRQIEKEREEAKKERELLRESIARGSSANKPEVTVNKSFFEKTGISLNEVSGDEREKPPAPKPDITVNYDAAYFKWKEDELSDREKEKKEEEAPKPKSHAPRPDRSLVRTLFSNEGLDDEDYDPEKPQPRLNKKQESDAYIDTLTDLNDDDEFEDSSSKAGGPDSHSSKPWETGSTAFAGELDEITFDEDEPSSHDDEFDGMDEADKIAAELEKQMQEERKKIFE